MANDFYDHTTFPTNGSTSSAASMRAELDAIEAGFGKLPALSGNASKIVRVNAGETALEATDFPATTGNGGKLLAVNAGATGFEATATPALGTPASGTLTNCTGLPASAVVNTPAGSIAAVTVQNAINELDTDKAALAANTFTGDQTLGNNNLKTIKTATFNSELTVAQSAGTLTVDWRNAQNIDVTPSQNITTMTFTAPNGPCHLQMRFTTGAYTITYPAANFYWLGGGAPTLATGKSTIVNMWYDGTNYWASGATQV